MAQSSEDIRLHAVRIAKMSDRKAAAGEWFDLLYDMQNVSIAEALHRGATKEMLEPFTETQARFLELKDEILANKTADIGLVPNPAAPLSPPAEEQVATAIAQQKPDEQPEATEGRPAPPAQPAAAEGA